MVDQDARGVGIELGNRAVYAILVWRFSQRSIIAFLNSDGPGTFPLENGYIDFYGAIPAAAGWLFCGWMPVDRTAATTACQNPIDVVVTLEGLSFQTDASAVLFHREDLKGEGIGLALYIRCADSISGPLLGIQIMLDAMACRLQVVGTTELVQEAELVSRLTAVLGNVVAGRQAEMVTLLNRRGYTGVNTLNTISQAVRIGIDDCVLCGDDGVLIVGWLLAVPKTVSTLSLGGNGRLIELNRDKFMRVTRRDVSDTTGVDLGVEDPECGFVAFVQTRLNPGAPSYLVVETESLDVGFVPLAPRRAHGVAPIRRLLEIMDADYGAVPDILSDVVAPAIERLNAHRLRTPPNITEIVHGPQPTQPMCSLIIPLFGRIDYFEYQLALLSADPHAAQCDIIYVLDDPTRRREILLLAESAFNRFQLSFRLLTLGENIGFGPASNIGLDHATANYVCFLNSDVFPRESGWIGRLCVDLELNPDLGAVGGLLLFEDGSVQHEGIQLQQNSTFGGLSFPVHPRKGWRPRPGQALERVDMITGACIVMPTPLARELGGFDESYIIGDFEDCDLCARLHAQGRACAVDHSVTLFHLERRSQHSPQALWRRNLTLYNAWVFNQRHRAEPLGMSDR